MRLARFLVDEIPRLGVVVGSEVFEVPGPGGAAQIEQVLQSGPRALATVESSAATGRARPIADLKLLAPLQHPSKIMCVGQNYAAHAVESRVEIPSEPVFFSKFVSSIVGPADPIQLPRVAPRRVDYEAELVVVIGRRGRDISEAEAPDFVAGYMVGNDISARDWQLKKPAGQWLLGKSFDSFLPIGPVFVTAEEIGDVGQLHITCRIGTELLQDDIAGSMVFGIPTLISYISQVATLEAGDLLLTGTPAGVGQSRVPPRWLRADEVLETAIDGLGSLRNRILPPNSAP